jgi:hypothetical protein
MRSVKLLLWFVPSLALQGSCSASDRGEQDSAGEAGVSEGGNSATPEGGRGDQPETGGRMQGGDASSAGEQGGPAGQGGLTTPEGGAAGNGPGGAGDQAETSSGGVGGRTLEGGTVGAAGADSPETPLLKLGDSCTDSATCESEFCIDGVCCASSCTALCAECNSDGRCVAGQADDACTVFPCPSSSDCRTYDSESVQCLAIGTCAGASDCLYTDSPRGQACDGPAEACDGEGNCSLLANGSACTTDDSCATGSCVDGTCGIRITSCAQLRRVASAGALVEVATLMVVTFPPTQARGGAVILDGSFPEDLHVCLDSTELPVEYTDGFNTMITLPESTAVGTHTVRVFDTTGKVSRELPLNVISEFEPGPHFTRGDGFDLPFPVRSDVFVPLFLPTYPPVTNSWILPEGGEFVVTGKLESNNGVITATTGGGGPRFDGRYDVTHHRVPLTFSAPTGNCNDSDCSWEYIGIFSCPSSEPVEILGALVDVCAPNLDYDDYYDSSGYMWIPRTIVLFPKDDPFSQLVFSN